MKVSLTNRFPHYLPILLIVYLFIQLRPVENLKIEQRENNKAAKDTYQAKEKQKKEENDITGKEFFKKLFWYTSREWPKSFVHTTYGIVESKRRSNLRVYFINHASCLIQMNNYNLLTDPVWSKRVGPLGLVGPKRITNPGIRIDDLPEIDCIVISHNHYDHLDLQTLKRLYKRNPNVKIIVPDKVEKLLIREGFLKKNIITMKWNEKIYLRRKDSRKQDIYKKENELVITCVPAQHFSGRGLFDRNKTLWAGFILNSGGYQIYFAGDTGFSKEMFTSIAEQISFLHISLIPIGAYKPRNLLKKVHVNPAEAVQIHQILKSERAIPIHYGTFRLSLETYGEAEEDLKKALGKQNLSKDAFCILPHGGFLDCQDPKKSTYKTGFITKKKIKRQDINQNK